MLTWQTISGAVNRPHNGRRVASSAAMRSRTRSRSPASNSVCIGTSAYLLHDCRRLDVVEFGKRAPQILIPLRHDRVLARPRSAWRTLAVSRVDRINHFHAVDHLAERGEALHVERRVVPVVDEKLVRPRVGTGGGKG